MRFAEGVPGGREVIAGIAVAAAALLTYSSSVANGFVWDDAVIIVGNAALRGDATALFGAIDAGRAVEPTPYYRPLTLLSFLAEERLHGLAAPLMHVFNVLLHAANAILVHRLARSLLPGTRAPLLAALLFAVHPLHAESVDFLSGGRNTMLACLFSLAALLLHLRSARPPQRGAALAGGTFFFPAGLLSKEGALMVLPFVAAIELDAVWGEPLAEAAPRVTGRLLPYLAAAAAWAAMRHEVLAGAGVGLEIVPGLVARLLSNFYIVPRYLLSVLWPPALSVRYEIPADLRPLTPLLTGAWLGIAAALGWLLWRRRSRATLVGLAWLVAFWLPVSGVVPFPSAPLADRYLYLPAIGLWLVVADQANRACPQGCAWRGRATAAAGTLLLVLAAVTFQKNLDWRSDVTLFTRYVENHPNSAFGRHNLGTAYLDVADDLGAAERELERALAIDPVFPRTRTQLGWIRLRRGDLEGALRHYDAAVVLGPLDAEAHLNRGNVLDQLGRHEEAISEYRRFLAVPGKELPRARARVEARLRELVP